MNFTDVVYDADPAVLGESLYAFAKTLYPICRSITGQGVRDTLAHIGEHISLVVNKIATGEQVFDWVIPQEWVIRDAWIKDKQGNRIVDFQKNNLHVVNYSVPVHKTLALSELKHHLHTLPNHADWIPYRTSYYNDSWGFCLSQNQLDAMPDDEFEVCIDSSHINGVLNYGEYLIKGEREEEIIFYTHICHPSLCNDNLSGLAVLTFLAKYLSTKKTKYTYRFIFAPGTIGSITWLSRNEDQLNKIQMGLVVALVGDEGGLTYKQSRHDISRIDKIVRKVLADHTQDYATVDFSPYGYDERQFCSPGINLDLGRLTRTPNGCYEEYHSSADDLDFIKPESLADSLIVCTKIIDVIENDCMPVNLSPKCEPQLGKRGLYSKSGGKKDIGHREYALLWILNQADGERSLLDIAIRSNLEFGIIKSAARDLCDAELLKLSELNVRAE